MADHPVDRIAAALLDRPEFTRFLRGSGATPSVHLLHGGAKSGAGWHDTGAKVRLVRDGEGLAVQVAPPRGVARTNLLTSTTFACEACAALLTYSFETLIRAVAESLIRDTREGKRYVARLR